jgi:MFS family permease
MRTAQQEFKRGWRVLIASSFGIASGLSGIAFYTFGVFIVPLTEAFGWSRGQVSTAASFLIIGTAFTAPIVGGIIDRYGARTVGLWSTLFVGLCYFALTQLNNNLYVFYASWLAIALIGGGTTPVVWTRAIGVWFDRGRGLALGLTLAGSGLTGIFGPLFVTYLNTTYGWQAGYMGIGALIRVVALPVLFLLFNEHPPAEAADEPHESHSPLAKLASSVLTGMTLQESFRSVSFWIIAGGFFMVSSTVAGLLINVVPMLIDRGLTSVEAAQIAGTLGIAVVIGRVGIGYLIDRVRAPLVARILLTLTAGGCLLLTLEGTPTWVAVISVMSMGLAAAAEVDLVAYLSARYFGLKAYGKIYGWQITAFYLGAAIGPILVGLAYDRFGSYLQVLYTAGALLLMGAIVVGSLGKPPEFSAEAAPAD